MKMVIDKLSSMKIDKKFVYILFPFLIIVAKFVRYTVMKESLVNQGIGHSFIKSIVLREY